MLISEAWLREYIDPDIDTLDLANQMTMAGLEVETVKVLSGDFENVVVAEIVSVEPHPDSKKLNVCKVDTGDEDPVLIVCGAPNATAGLRVPFARVGASLPGGIIIKVVEIRGVSSAGMLSRQVPPARNLFFRDTVVCLATAQRYPLGLGILFPSNFLRDVQPAWLVHESLRSRATGTTVFQHHVARP